MGEYADIAVSEGFSEWEAIERSIADGDYEHDIAAIPGMRFRRSRPSRASAPCRGCGKGALFWLHVGGKWRLHHYAMFGTMKRPGYVLHRCGFASDGAPLPYPDNTNPKAGAPEHG